MDAGAGHSLNPVSGDFNGDGRNDLAGEALTATTYYVDKDNVHGGSCSDSNNGTSWSTPFCTIQKAANVVNAGDTVIVADGVYNHIQDYGEDGKVCA